MTGGSADMTHPFLLCWHLFLRLIQKPLFDIVRLTSIFMDATL
jgi:hypothetical protein